MCWNSRMAVWAQFPWHTILFIIHGDVWACNIKVASQPLIPKHLNEIFNKQIKLMYYSDNLMQWSCSANSPAISYLQLMRLNLSSEQECVHYLDTGQRLCIYQSSLELLIFTLSFTLHNYLCCFSGSGPWALQGSQFRALAPQLVVLCVKVGVFEKVAGSEGAWHAVKTRVKFSPMEGKSSSSQTHNGSGSAEFTA